MTVAPAPPIDWDDVHRRLDRLRQIVDRGWAPDAEATARILRERARALAVPPPRLPAGAMLDVVVFHLAGERYGIESAYVREAFPLTDLTRLPGTPPFILGIINIRGEIVSVVDLGRLFDLPAPGITDLNRVLVLAGEAMVFGLLGDRLEGVCTVAENELQGGPPGPGGGRGDYLLGIAGDGLAILDGKRLLADPRLVVGDTVDERQARR